MHRRDRLSFLVIAAAIGAAIFAIGGAPRWAQAAIAVIAAAALALTLLSRRRFDRRPPLVVLIGVAAAWTAFQILPLPAMLVDALTPTLSALREDGVVLAGVSVANTLTMDPGASMRALSFLLTISAIAVVALRLSVSEGGRYVLMATVAGFIGLAAIVSGIHELVDARTLFGIYEPSQVPPIIGPLLNPNHLGCLTAIGVATSVGLLLYARQPTARRVAWALNGLVCLVVTTATFSRGAIVGLAAGLLVTGATLVAQRIHAVEHTGSRRKREKLLATTLPIGVLVSCGLVIGVYLGADTVMQQLESTSLDELQAPRTKYAAWKSSVELVKESPWVGVGRGAFESAFTRVHPGSAFSTFSHPENETVQAIVEWGIPAVLVLGAIAAWMVLLVVRRWRDGPLAAGAFGALMVVAFQSNFDFGMELLGLALPVTVILATVTYVPISETSGRELVRTRLARLGHVLMVAGGAVLVWSPLTRTIEEDHAAVEADASAVKSAIEAHPLDYLSYAKLAEQLAKRDDASTVRVLNHALRLHPTHPALHWIAARLLVRTGRLSQAEAEYTTAIRNSQNPGPIIAEIIALLPAERAARALPLELHIGTVTRLVPAGVAGPWLEQVIAQRHDIRAAEAMYRIGLRTKDLSLAEGGARHRCRLMPSTECRVELVRVLARAGKHASVIDELNDVAEWQGRRDLQVEAWLMACDAHAAQDDRDRALDCLRRLEISGLAPLDDPEIQRRQDAW